MVARPLGVLNIHGFPKHKGILNPVFTVENSADNNPIHKTQ